MNESTRQSQIKSLKLSGFGSFELRHKNPRSGRNPKTGQEALVPARRVVVFRSGQKLRDRFNGPVQVTGE